MGSVGHVSRGEQKVQTASQQSPGTASTACEGLIEEGRCDRIRRNNGLEADKGFSRMPRGNDNIHVVLRGTNIYSIIKCCVDSSIKLLCLINYRPVTGM